MPKEIPRPLDEKLREQVGRPEAEVVEWWRARVVQLVAIPADSARAGALMPELRELATLPRDQRLALVRARVLAFADLSAEDRQKIVAARRIGTAQLPHVAREDITFLRDEVLPTLPAEIAERLRADVAEFLAERPG